MPLMMQILGFVLFVFGVGLALWVSLWLVVIFFVIGVAAVVWTHLKDYLLRKGILNPKPGVPLDEEAPEAPITVIEGDYKRVDSE